MKIFDITVPIKNGMTVWPGQPVVDIHPLQTVNMNGSMVSSIHLTSHTGTHVDAPAHFLDGGETVDLISPHVFIGTARVFDLSWITLGDPIEREFLEKYELATGERVLFKTANSSIIHTKEFQANYTHLSYDAAQYLIEHKTLLVGIDYFGIEKKGSPGHLVHTSLFMGGVVIVEGLDLSIVPEDTYDLYCFPLRVAGCDGAPARAILVTKS